ncbi:2'-5' RNA ligase family protein [Streptomyces sp. NPDC006326]|uniref:2'-5' RNA ligase family protein n=1 Tax=Streptomyces sp. NPDC006326 TaxID=3156752 RepID=UPI0033AD5C5D
MSGAIPRPARGCRRTSVLFPFLDDSRMDGSVQADLADLIGGHRAFNLRFARFGRFPEVLYAVPEPDTQVRRLTEAIVERWPEAPPYGGKFADVLPHLTIAQGVDEDVLGEIEAALLGSLPFTSRVSSVDLMVFDGTKWQEGASFRLRP